MLCTFDVCLVLRDHFNQYHAISILTSLVLLIITMSAQFFTLDGCCPRSPHLNHMKDWLAEQSRPYISYNFTGPSRLWNRGLFLLRQWVYLDTNLMQLVEP
jgi:hypothetical protein